MAVELTFERFHLQTEAAIVRRLGEIRKSQFATQFAIYNDWRAGFEKFYLVRGR